MKYVIQSAAITLLVLAAVLALAIVFGAPKDPPPMKRITQPFEEIRTDREKEQFVARDGSRLTYRRYAANGEPAKGSVVLLHGSGASSESMYPLAQALSDANYTAYALDIRGHGTPSPKGNIAYIGQLENDLEDFMHAVDPTAPSTLIGFSSGGGFALRLAGSPHQVLFNNYLLLSPFISQDSPTQRPGSGGWVEIGLPRYIALVLLNRLGIDALNHLTVMRFALPENAPEYLTREYSFNLAQNYRPQADYQATIQAVKQPMRVMAGTNDEAFHTDRFKQVFQNGNADIPVTLLPGVNHSGLILENNALDAIVKAVDEMNSDKKPAPSPQ
tara:strand:- start:62853 stop:63842 length:990 start_codon:yes stop_codon:yes gene_type:complete